jgi:hypothetical protein
MRPAPQQNIHIHLPRRNQQGIRIAARNNRMAMHESDAETAMRDDF